MRAPLAILSLTATLLTGSSLTEAQDRKTENIQFAFTRPSDPLTIKAGAKLNAEVEMTNKDTATPPQHILFVLAKAGSKGKNRIWERFPKLKAGGTPARQTYTLEAPLPDETGNYELMVVALMGKVKDQATGKMIDKSIESEMVRVTIEK